MCQNLDLRIVNGRFGLDSALATCKDTSVIDYFAISPELFSCTLDMKVKSFNPLFSDVHNTIELHVHPSFLVCNNNDNNMNPDPHDNFVKCRFVWSNDKKTDFIQKLDSDLLSGLENELDKMLDEKVFDKVTINDINGRLCELFTKSASECNMGRELNSMNKNINKKKASNKNWFDKSCKSDRNEFNSAKNKLRYCKSKHNLDVLRHTGRAYKRSIRNAVRKYERNFNKKLRSLKTGNPREFWKLICTNDGKDTKSKIQLDILSGYFSKLNKDENMYENFEKQRSLDNCVLENEFLNAPFNENEVRSVLSSLKSGKAAGPDCLINEFFKCSSSVTSKLLMKMFNVILVSGYLPDSWSSGWIVPIYKNKGSKIDPNNYRGISLINCICKIFTSLISIRITKYCDSVELLGNEQAGFRKNYSTCDHIFALHVLIAIYTKVLKKKLYCCFVDYKKAFDSVPRIHLWYKLLSNGINGKILNVIKGLYSTAKSAVKQGSTHGFFFNCEIGVRQGDNLSPLLFALYLNDLQEHLSKAYNGLSSSFNLIQDWVQDEDTVVFLKLFTILYADDTVVFAESRAELQAAMHGMLHYCIMWKLDINVQKTKVVIYGSKPGVKELDFKFGEHNINVISEYTYLGICFPCNNNMNKGISVLKNQASRAMFSLIKKSRKLGLDFDIQLQLFDSLILPILLYGCEVWGFKKIDMLERLHLQYCKILLNVKKCTPNVMVLGELGRLPIEFHTNCRMLGFWHKLINGFQNKISCILYKLIYNLHIGNVYLSEWLKKIKDILYKCGMSEYWLNPNKVSDTNYASFKNCIRKNWQSCTQIIG